MRLTLFLVLRGTKRHLCLWEDLYGRQEIPAVDDTRCGEPEETPETDDVRRGEHDLVPARVPACACGDPKRATGAPRCDMWTERGSGEEGVTRLPVRTALP